MLLALLLACGGSTPPPAPEAVLEVTCEASDPLAWQGCVGQRVTLNGAVPEVVYAHPILGDPQGYLEVAGIQVVVVGVAEGACTRVTGVLDRVDLGGEPGTRGSYKGWVLRDAVCE